MTAIRNGDPNIQRRPTPAEMRDLVERVIPPDSEDSQFRAFIKIITMIADPDNDTVWHLAMTAARHAYSFTDDFERSFRRFGGMAPHSTTIVDYGQIRHEEVHPS